MVVLEMEQGTPSVQLAALFQSLLKAPVHVVFLPLIYAVALTLDEVHRQQLLQHRSRWYLVMPVLCNSVCSYYNICSVILHTMYNVLPLISAIALKVTVPPKQVVPSANSCNGAALIVACTMLLLLVHAPFVAST